MSIQRNRSFGKILSYSTCLFILFGFLLLLTPLPAFSGGGKETGKVSLVMWGMNLEGFREFQEAIVQSFNKAHPNVYIDLQEKGDNIQELIATAIVSKTEPDFVYWWAGPSTRYLSGKGALLALDDLYPKRQWDQAQGISTITVNGKRYGVPADIAYEVLMYNKDIFNKAGLDPNVFPSGWAGFLTACEKIKKIGIAPLAYGDKEGWAADVLQEGLAVQGFNSAEEFKSAVVNGTFTDPRYLQGLSHVKELYDRGFLYEGGMSEEYNLMMSQFISGKAAMMRGMGEHYMAAKKELGSSVGLATYPKWTESGLAGKVKVTLSYAWYVMSYSKHPKEAVLAISDFMSRENNNLHYKLRGTFPASTDWDKSLVNDKELEIIMERTKKEGTAPEIYDNLPSDPIYTAMTKNYSLFLLGEITAEEFGKRVDAAREGP